MTPWKRRDGYAAPTWHSHNAPSASVVIAKTTPRLDTPGSGTGDRCPRLKVATPVSVPTHTVPWRSACSAVTRVLSRRYDSVVGTPLTCTNRFNPSTVPTHTLPSGAV